MGESSLSYTLSSQPQSDLKAAGVGRRHRRSQKQAARRRRSQSESGGWSRCIQFRSQEVAVDVDEAISKSVPDLASTEEEAMSKTRRNESGRSRPPVPPPRNKPRAPNTPMSEWRPQSLPRQRRNRRRLSPPGDSLSGPTSQGSTSFRKQLTLPSLPGLALNGREKQRHHDSWKPWNFRHSHGHIDTKESQQR